MYEGFGYSVYRRVLGARRRRAAAFACRCLRMECALASNEHNVRLLGSPLDATSTPSPAWPWPHPRHPRASPGYYSGDEDAFDMRKAMPRDVNKQSVVPLKRDVHPHELEFD